jgi:hypothetical protein
MLLIPLALFEKRQNMQPPVRRVLKCKTYNPNKWEQLRLFQDPCLSLKKKTLEPTSFPILESGGTPNK